MGKPRPPIQLKELNQDNYKEVLRLSVAEDQKGFVASNAISVAQAHFEKQAWFRGIYRDEVAIGFVMLDINIEKPEYYLWRYMIDKKHQGKGYGLKALELIIDHVRALPKATNFLLSYVPGPGEPKGFYEKLGFVETGEEEDGEKIMRLTL